MTVTVGMPVPSAVPITVAFPLRSPPYVSPAAFRPSALPGSFSAPFLYHAVSPDPFPASPYPSSRCSLLPAAQNLPLCSASLQLPTAPQFQDLATSQPLQQTSFPTRGKPGS
ncbi:unnamed protein product [Musa hybrid cultivar]